MKHRAFLIYTFSFLISHFSFLICNATEAQADRTWYLAGEAMTVSVTADDALIAYAELCDTKGLAASTVVSLENGAGSGVVELPSTLHSGYYLLSVYTHHDDEVSQQLVAVVNPLRKSMDDDIEWVRIAHPDSLSYADSGFRFQDSGFRFQDSGFSSNHKVQSSSFKVQSTSFKVQSLTFGVRETEGPVIMARVRNVRDGMTFRGGEIRPSLSVVGKQIHYFEGRMLNDTTAAFFVHSDPRQQAPGGSTAGHTGSDGQPAPGGSIAGHTGIHGRLPVVLSARTSTGVSLPIEIVSPFLSLLPEQLPPLVFHYQRSEVEARSIAMQRRARRDAPLDSLGYDATLFGMAPELSYNLDEYRQFLTVREVLLEYVRCVSKKKVNGISQLIVRKEDDHYHSFLPTLVLIDGMPVFDVERLLSYDARRVHHINIYGDQYTFGSGIYNGVLSFVTRSGALTNYPTEPNMQYLVYDFP